MRLLLCSAAALTMLSVPADAQMLRREVAARDAHHYAVGERLDHRWGDYGEVRDWHERRLDAPPAGYRWVRHGDDYVMAAIATGVVTGVVAGAAANSAYPPAEVVDPY